MTEYQRIDYKRLSKLLSARLQTAGVPETQADVEAAIMAEADLLEVPSHGVRMLPGLLKALDED